MAKKRISIIIPCFNEEGNINPVVSRIRDTLLGLESAYDFEILFCDNHSTDNTFMEIKRISETCPLIRAIRYSKNIGYQNSLLEGLKRCTGDAAILLDCDLQDPPELIIKFLEAWERGYRVVGGVRRTRNESIILSLARRAFYRIMNMVSDDNNPLDMGDFRLIDRGVIDVLSGIEATDLYLRGEIASLNFSTFCILYDRDQRSIGDSKFKLPKLFSFAVDSLVSQSILLIKFPLYFGITLFLLIIFLSIFYTLAIYIFSVPRPDGYLTLFLIQCITLAVITFFLGVIAEYCRRVLRIVSKRPTAIIEDKIR